METKKHNLNEEYLNSLTEEQRINEMREWTDDEWDAYYCPNGTITLDEFSRLLGDKINELWDETYGSHN